MPQAIGPYRVDERIGQGGMGEVYRGYDARLDRPVALKHVKADAKDPAAARERFRREARALARVRHPVVVEVYDWVEDEDGDWIVMELLEGRSLRSRIAEGPLEVRQALDIARDIAAGLAAVHAHGIVHRDLNPANVMWDPSGPTDSASGSIQLGGASAGRASAGHASAGRASVGRASAGRASVGRASAGRAASVGHIKIVDFGLAKRVASMDGVTLTETISREGQLVGTVRYMSPEQAAGHGVDPRSDLFSLGVVLYEMLTGASPFAGDSVVETLTRICTVAETPVHRRVPAVPGAVSEVVGRMLRKEPERRLQTAAEVAEVLGALGVGVAAGLTDPELRAALPETGSDSDVTSPTQVIERPPGSPVSGSSVTGSTITGSTITGEPSHSTVSAEASTISGAQAPGRHRPGWRWVGAAAVVLVAGLIGGWMWSRSIPEPLAVAVLAPEVGTVDDSVDAALVSRALRGALTAGLLSYEAVSLTPADQIDDLEGSSLTLARALAVDEVVTANFDCAARMCQVSLSRVAGDSGDLVWGATFPSRADDLLVLHAAVVQNFRRGYADRRVRPGAADLEVRAEDYRTFLELQRDYAETSPLSSEEVLVELAELHQTSPRFLDSYLLEARVAIRRFYDTRDPALFDKALDACRTAHEMAPEDPRPLALLASVARDAGELELWRKTLGTLGDLTVGDPRTLALEALLSEQIGEREVGLRGMREAARLRPSWRLLRELGMMEYRNGNIAAARAALEAARELVPNHLLVQSDLAQVELLSGDPHRAVAVYESLVEQSPEIGYLANLGVSYFLLERYADAAPVFRQALEKAPGSPPLLLNLADAELLLEREDEARALYRRVVEILAEDAFGATWQGKTIGAQAQAHLGEVELAVAACQEALQLAPDNPQVALEVAMVYALVGEHASALVNVEEALRGGVDPRWFRFPWFGALRQAPRFQQLVGAASSPWP